MREQCCFLEMDVQCPLPANWEIYIDHAGSTTCACDHHKGDLSEEGDVIEPYTGHL